VQVQMATSVPWSLTALSLHMEIINVDHDWRVVKIISRAGNSCSDLLEYRRSKITVMVVKFRIYCRRYYI